MRRTALSVLAATLILAASFIAYFSRPEAAGRLLSSYISIRTGVRIDIAQARAAGWGKVRFTGLRAGGAEGEAHWLLAEEGELAIDRFPLSLTALRLDLKRFSLRGSFRKNAAALMDMVSSQRTDAETAGIWPWFDEARFFIRQDQGSTSVRVAAVKSDDLHLSGRVRFEGRNLAKMNFRWAVPESLFSQWPGAAVRKMSLEKNGWRSAGLAFGGQTWTLRGSRGPLLQFSAIPASK